MKLSVLIGASLLITSLSSFGQATGNGPGNNLENKYAEAAREAVLKTDNEFADSINKYTEAAIEAAVKTDKELADQIQELVSYENIGGIHLNHLSYHELECISLLNLEAKLQSKKAVETLKRKVRKKILKEVKRQGNFNSCY